jgi:hypothetical protein
MIRQLDIPESHLRALRLLCARLPLDRVNWALTGSVGHRLQGVDVAVHDLDVQTDEAGAWQAARAMSEYVVKPVKERESERIKSIFGVLRVDDVTVELMGRLQKRPGPDAPWGPATDPHDHVVLVNRYGLQIPVLSLAYEAGAYDAMGRHDRAALLRAALDEGHG